MSGVNQVTQDMVSEAEAINVRGVHRLAGAILVQAIEDIRCGSGRRREDAIRWVTETSEEQFSFVFCCRMLSRDPEEVRRFLVRQSIPGWQGSDVRFQVAASSSETDPPPWSVRAEDIRTDL